MMTTVNHPAAQHTLRRVPLSRPFVWLAEGWDDLLHHRAASLAYGLLVSLLGLLILAYSRHPFYMAMMWVGFLLVGPVLTAGCCELSRLRDEGEPASFDRSLRPLSRNRRGLLGVAETLSLLALVWFAISGSVYFTLMGDIAPSPASTVWGDVMTQVNNSQLLAYAIIGLILCATVFALSVVTVPMVIGRHVDAATAMRISLRAVTQNLPAMALWALLIVALVMIGFATGLIGMIFIFPLLGHATWRAYRELVED